MIQKCMRQALVDFKASMQWSDQATEHEKSLVLGNLGGFMALLEMRTAALESTVEAMARALEEIDSMQPEPFEFPADWEAQIAACCECARYKTHPIQRGICDEHRRPLWARERHDSDEEKRMGYRMKLKARAALASWRGLVEEEGTK